MTAAAPWRGHATDDLILGELARWLDGVPTDAPERVRAWSDATWDRFRRLVSMHGLAAVLAHDLRERGREEAVPPATRAWLDEQEERNAQRVDRMHGELAAILRRATEQGIEVIPLKGSYLAGVAAVEPRRRPMADIDLLVRPAQRRAMRSVLRDLGYRRVQRPTVGRKPDMFFRDGGRVIVDREGEHPDNPRPVDLHVAVQRHLWEWLSEDELTAALWASATPGELLGERAMLPALGVVFEHFAVHATLAHMRGRGRFSQWLDLAQLAGGGGAPGTWVVPRLAFPSLALAARALPAIRETVDVEGLAATAGSPAVVVDWARGVPLGVRAGLETGLQLVPPRARAGTLERWRPSALRLGVAYGRAPRATALARHAAQGLRHARWHLRARLILYARRIVRPPARRFLRRLVRSLRRMRRRAG